SGGVLRHLRGALGGGHHPTHRELGRRAGGVHGTGPLGGGLRLLLGGRHPLLRAPRRRRPPLCAGHRGCPHRRAKGARGDLRRLQGVDGVLGSSRFWVRWHTSTGLEQMLVASNVLDTTPWNICAEWVTPFQPEFSGETKYVGSNIPGVASNKTPYSEMQLQKYDNSWTTNLPTFLAICPWPVRYSRSAISVNNAFNIWTNTETGGSL